MRKSVEWASDALLAFVAPRRSAAASSAADRWEKFCYCVDTVKYFTMCMRYNGGVVCGQCEVHPTQWCHKGEPV